MTPSLSHFLWHQEEESWQAYSISVILDLIYPPCTEGVVKSLTNTSFNESINQAVGGVLPSCDHVTRHAVLMTITHPIIKCSLSIILRMSRSLFHFPDDQLLLY